MFSISQTHFWICLSNLDSFLFGVPEKSLKQESVLPEEDQSSQDAAGETLREETEETNPNANSSTKATQVEKFYFKLFRIHRQGCVKISAVQVYMN